ncbi:hypothetical protein SSX86_006066 [Deinandra increscens subsp. villosa]|uniref:CASP-like protein n=1 Tax=Deinandra increscens subsp. villosa TaxID=3103831 RepID=A0AAP0H923_9ASTR
MASTDTTVKPTSPENKQQAGSSRIGVVVDVCLRFLLFATALAAVIIMVTSKQTKLIPVAPGYSIPFVAKFNQSPAFIYFVAALSVACVYSVISGVLSALVLMKPGGNSATVRFQFVILLDALLLGIVTAATGAAGGVGYIGYKGNSHSQWHKICDNFGSYCSYFLSLISSITLLLLVWLSVYVLSKKISTR